MATKKKKAAKQTGKGAEEWQDSAASGLMLRVPVREIRCYERNPRRTPNPEYDRIRASILAKGLDQPLVITQRPDDTGYIVQAGGNTRLQILKQLHAETGDERFGSVNCRLVGWEGESSCVLAHLRENELRGSLTFIDKARAVMDVRALVAEERRVDSISLRQLEICLREHGFNASHTLISLMQFAAQTLLPVIPVALAAGLGKRSVRDIRTLQGIAGAVWQRHAAGTDADFEEVFAALCRRHDGLDWDLAPLRDALEIEIAETAEVSIHVIRLEFDCRIAGETPEIPEFVRTAGQGENEFPVAPRDEPATISEAERQAAAITELGPSADKDDDAARGMETEPEAAEEGRSDGLFRQIGVASKARLPLAFLRQTSYALARRLAERHGIGELVAPLEDSGTGFVVRDMPDRSLLDSLDTELHAEVMSTWWQLLAFAEVCAVPPELLEANLGHPLELLARLSATRSASAAAVWTPDPALQAVQFWRPLNHDDWCDWLRLAHSYRELHRMSRVLNKPLWSLPE